MDPWIFRKQFSEEENNLQSQEAELSRKRRKAGEPDLIDPSQIPHIRVQRIEKDPESAYDETSIPHVREPRQQHMDDQEKYGSELLMTRIPLTSISRSDNIRSIDSFPVFQFPPFESEKLSDRLSHSRGFIPDRFTSEFGSSLRNPSLSNSDHIIPEGQNIFHTYKPRRHPFRPSSSKPFFPSAPRQHGRPGPRPPFNAHASTRGPSTRGASPRGPTFRPSHGPGLGPKGFREFHDPFYGPDFRGGQEAISKPDFHFPSPSPHREDEYPNENSLLGSGNFEILRGGTFYEPGDYHLNHHPYDHLLDGGYSPFHSNAHSNNYVDDFFSNFRDFSEFAARSDSGEVDYHGFSEPITSIIDPNSDMDHTGEESSINETQAKPLNEINKNKTESKGKKSDKDKTTTTKSPTHWQPKNIQELLEEIDPRPSHHSTSELIVDEQDPMIAMF